MKPPIRDAEYEVISGPLPSTQVEQPAPLSPRRHNMPRIIWQVWSYGMWLFIGVFIALLYLGNHGGIGIWFVENMGWVLGACVGAFAVLGVVAEMIIRRRRRRMAGRG